MTAWSASLPKDFVYPATAGLLVVLVTILLLFLSSTRAIKFWKKSTKGTKFVFTTDEGTVRRSTRSRKTVSRWSPEELGSGTPTNKQGASAVSPLEKVTPKLVAKALKAESPVEDTPKRGPGRPRKTPPPASSPTSPVRTRRGAKTPAK